MEEKILELASTQGIWTVLTVALIFLYPEKSREKRSPSRRTGEKISRDYIKFNG